MMDRASFGFVNSISKEVVWLSFDMVADDLACRWAMRVFKEVEKKKLQAVPIGAFYVDESAVRAEIGRYCAMIVEKDAAVSWRDSYPQFVQSPYIEKRILYSLLEYCRLREQQEIVRKLAINVREYLTLYNTDVHFDIGFKVRSPWLFALASEDYKLFSADRRDGWLYLEYAAQGRPSLAAFEEKAADGLRPQRTYSSNTLVVYREDLDLSRDIGLVREWVAKILALPVDDPMLSIGLIPIGRPAHSYSRTQVQGIQSVSEPAIRFSYSIDGKSVGRKEIKKIRRQARNRSFMAHLASTWSNRADASHIGTKLIDYLWREDGIIKQILQRVYHDVIMQSYYDSRPVVVEWAHILSWPLRKPYYIASYQFKKRILKRQE
ncbi:MAG: hypothetical protein IPJ84_00015 [Bdellovibrionales bacterium]|nr:hypothetical protein [Bdellovibrionales bacterium]